MTNPAEALRARIRDVLKNEEDRDHIVVSKTERLTDLIAAALATPSPPPDEGVSRIPSTYYGEPPDEHPAQHEGTSVLLGRVPKPGELDWLDKAASSSPDEPVQELHELPSKKVELFCPQCHEMVHSRAEAVAHGLLPAHQPAPATAPDDIGRLVEEARKWADEHLVKWNERAHSSDLSIKDRALVRKLATVILSLASERAELREALKPFAKEAQRWSDKWPDDTQVSVHQRGAGCDQCGADPGCETHDIKVSDLRRARSLTLKAST